MLHWWANNLIYSCWCSNKLYLKVLTANHEISFSAAEKISFYSADFTDIELKLGVLVAEVCCQHSLWLLQFKTLEWKWAVFIRFPLIWTLFELQEKGFPDKRETLIWFDCFYLKFMWVFFINSAFFKIINEVIRLSKDPSRRLLQDAFLWVCLVVMLWPVGAGERRKCVSEWTDSRRNNSRDVPTNRPSHSC